MTSSCTRGTQVGIDAVRRVGQQTNHVNAKVRLHRVDDPAELVMPDIADQDVGYHNSPARCFGRRHRRKVRGLATFFAGKNAAIGAGFGYLSGTFAAVVLANFVQRLGGFDRSGKLLAS